MKPHVDVTGKEPKKEASVRTVTTFALGDKYPLDSYAQVKAASAYFDEFGRRFEPEQRREYCTNLLKRAEALAIPVSDSVRRYGAESFASDEELKVACDLRKNIITNEALLPLLDRLYEKRAEIGAEMYAATLAEFDKIAGINLQYDKDIPDPYYSTFNKQAATVFSEVIGNDTITEEMLRTVGKVGVHTLSHTFGKDFAEEFRKDPVGIFKSLPRDQKLFIMRMASDDAGPVVTLQS
jgi:hypothetical protein